MVFWLSVIVFIAGIMTYMFFPRNDQYQLDMYKQEGNIVSFVNQHQVAKDLLHQRIMWKVDNENGIHAMPYFDLIGAAPDLMSVQDVYQVNQTSALNPNPGAENSVGNYTSAVVCMTSCEAGTTGCVNGKKMTSCPADEQYVITYGYMPEWWGKEAQRKQAWFKSMLKRTRGGIGCGLLAYRGENEEHGLYALDNAQKHVGYQVVDGKRVIPPVLTQKLREIGLTTCAPGSVCTDPLQDLMFCMTPFVNPYLGTPVFWWDSLNNMGTGVDVSARGRPLVGAMAGNAVDSWDSVANYTIMGTVSSQQNGNNHQTLFRINEDTSLFETCTNNLCTFSVRQGETDLLAVSDLPDNREYAFVYSVEAGTQTLTVYYSEVSDGKLNFTSTTTSRNDAMPVFSTPAFEDSVGTKPYLRSIRLYNGRLTTRQVNHNIKADQKRFGL